MAKLIKILLLTVATMQMHSLKSQPIELSWRLYHTAFDNNLVDSDEYLVCELPFNQEQTDCVFSEYGQATLISEKIHLKQSLESYAFYLARYRGSLSVSIQELDTKRILAQKKTGHFNKRAQIEGVGPVYFEFSIPKDTYVRIIIEHSNALHYNAEIRTRPKLGPSTEVIKPILTNSLLEFTSLGILLSASIYNFMLWLRRRQEQAALILSLTALCTAVRLATMSSLAAWLVGDANYLIAIKRMEYMTVPLLVGYGYYYHLAFDSCKWIGRFIHYLWLSSLANVLFIAFAPVYYIEKWVILSQLQILSAVCVALTIAWNSLRNRRDGAIANFIGCVLILIAAIWDITIDRGITEASLFMVPLAGAIYAILQSEILATRNATNHMKVNSLSLRNSEQQIELRVETESRLKLASSVAHYINNPLNYMQFARQSILLTTRNLEDKIAALLGPEEPNESSEHSRCRESFHSDFKKIYEPLETLEQGLLNVSEIVKEIRYLSGIDGIEISEFNFHKLAMDAKTSLELNFEALELARIYLAPSEAVTAIGSSQIISHALASFFKLLLKSSDCYLSVDIFKQMEIVTCKVSPAVEIDDRAMEEISKELELLSKKAKAEIKLVYFQDELSLQYRFSNEYGELSA